MEVESGIVTTVVDGTIDALFDGLSKAIKNK